MTRATKIRIFRRGASMLFYPAALPLSRHTLTYVTGIIRRHRRQIGSPWRKLSAGRQALLALAYLRKGERFAGLAAGFGLGTATAWWYATLRREALFVRVEVRDLRLRPVAAGR